MEYSLNAAAMLELLPDAVVVADAGGMVRYANRAVADLLGHEPTALVGCPLTVLMPNRFRAAHAAGFARFRATGTGELIGVTTQVPALHAAGHEVPVDLTLSPLSGEEGVVVGVLRDAGTTVLLERQLQVSRYLAAILRVTESLAVAEDVEAAFRQLLPSLCDQLDWDAASLWEPAADGASLAYAGTWTAPGQHLEAVLGATVNRRFLSGEGLPGLTWRTGRPVVIDDVRTDHRFVRRDAAREDDVRTAVAFPVLQGEVTLAVVELFSRTERTVPPELVEVLAGAGRQIGQFVGRLRAEAEMRRLADTLQRSLLPSRLPEIPGVQLAARYRPGGGQALVGGDTYDVIPLHDGRWMILIADVCGTGAEAAAVTALTRHTARASAAAADGPAEVLCAVNTALLREHATGPLRFVTAVCVLLEQEADGHRVRVGVAGHPLPILRSPGRGLGEVGLPGRPLGIDEDCRFDEVTAVLPAGATLVLYTDGATEARDDRGRQFGEDGLREVLERAPGDAQGTVAAIVAAVDAQLCGSRHEADDLAVLALTVPS